MLADSQPVPIPDKIIEARNEVKLKQKLNYILHSHQLVGPSLQIGDLIKVNVKPDKAKYGKRLSPTLVLAIDLQAGSVRIVHLNGKLSISAFEDTLHALT